MLEWNDKMPVSELLRQIRVDSPENYVVLTQAIAKCEILEFQCNASAGVMPKSKRRSKKEDDAGMESPDLKASE